MALSLTDRTKPRDGGSRGMNTNFAAVKHAQPQNIAVFDRSGPDDLGEMGQANSQ